MALLEQKTLSDQELLNILAGAELEPGESLRKTLVDDADIGENYVEGSQGEVKYLDEYITASPEGTKMKRYTFKYTNASYPTDAILVSVAIIDYTA